jgi:hypothetical protein
LGGNINMDLSHLSFKKQFYISQKKINSVNFNHWVKTELQNKLFLSTHPELLVTYIQSESSQLILLGTIIDPENPKHSNKSIISLILSKANSFTDIEKLFYGLGGRWVLIAIVKSECRIYHDAAGLKPVFYTRIDKHTCIAASQPVLLEKLGFTQKNQKLISTFQKFPNSNSWPLGVIPFNNVKQLLPNHFLDFNNQITSRFWPTEKSKNTDTDIVINEINQLLKGAVKALTYRNNCIMSLTAGYDSRMLYSTTIGTNINVDFFTLKSSITPGYDIETPKSIANRFKIKHTVNQLQEKLDNDKEIIATLSNNVGNMYYDRSMQNIVAYARVIGKRTHLPGSVAEIGRCYYYPYGKRYSPLSGKSLARYCGFKSNPDAIESFSQWLSLMPENMQYSVLDLAYWEHRLGVWGACGLTFREGLIEQIPPMNNRKFMELCLSVPTKDRFAPYDLFRKIMEINEPGLLEFLFNDEKNYRFMNKYPLLKRSKNILINRLQRIFK